jgi:hypothetical protein
MDKPLREIDFPSNTHEETKRRVLALAWATNRRGRNPWKSRYVVREVVKYLQKEGLDIDNADVRYAIRWVVHNGYGFDRRAEDKVKTTIEFNFHPDVDLNVSKPSRKIPLQVPTTELGPITQQEARGMDVRVGSNFGGPALPGTAPLPTVYKLYELSELLVTWSQSDPDKYAEWVEMAVAQLRYTVAR